MRLFCNHKWKTHVKVKTEKIKVVEVNYYDEVFKIPYTREVLICEKCGKIQEIRYLRCEC